MDICYSSFQELNNEEFYTVNGGDFWTGASVAFAGITVIGMAVVALTSPVSIPVAIFAFAAFNFGTAAATAGVAVMCGAQI